MLKAVYNWVNFSFKVYFALLTAQVLILCMFLGGYVFCVFVLALLGLL